MNTSLAAAKARRTVATIRTWCRRGVIAATKTNGRWTIDETSLDYRISLDKPTPKPVVLTTEAMVAIGGNRWTKAGKDRVYINNWADFAGIQVTRYNTGNISSAYLPGGAVANSRIHHILGAIDKVYFDAADGKLHARHYGAKEVEVRYLRGERETINLLAMTFAGIRAAVAAL